MATPDVRRPSDLGAGIGLRLPHVAEVAATRPPVAWFEVHPENFLANPHAYELLEDVARNYPISAHTVGISIGSAHGLDRAHLARLATLVGRINPVLVSGHLAWSTHGGEYLNDLLPLPYDAESLALVSDHVLEVQDALGRQFLVENPSSYVAFAHSTMSETAFLAALVDRTGCRLLCDVSNVVVSANNMGYDPYAYLDALPANAIGELHLGGYTSEPDPAVPGGDLLIDTHAAPVAAAAWELYEYAVWRIGRRPTMVEWDNGLPPLATIIAEASRASRILDAGRAWKECHRAVAR